MFERLRSSRRAASGSGSDADKGPEPDDSDSGGPGGEASDPDAATDATRAENDRHMLSRLLGIEVGRLGVYLQALRHRSLLRRKPDSRLRSNERLEFLGDAVLGFVVAEYLYDNFPSKNEGFLTRLRSKLVNRSALAARARSIDLGAHIQMSDNMVNKAGQENDGILSDALEAVIGALYLDLGMEAARDFIHRTVLSDVDLVRLAERRDNHKSLLLEFAQARGLGQPVYHVAAQSGPSHDRTFIVDVEVGGRMAGRGTAASKKAAEQEAAMDALDRLGDDASDPPSPRSLTGPASRSETDETD